MTRAIRISPVLAWALLLALAAALWAGVIAPVQDWSAGEAARLEQRIAVLERQRTLLETGETFSDALAESNQAVRTWPVRFGAPDSRGQTGLQSQVRALASAAGVELTRLQVGETMQESSGLALLALKVDADAELKAIQAFLIAVQKAVPAILVEEAAIRATGREDRLKLALDLRAPIVEVE